MPKIDREFIEQFKNGDGKAIAYSQKRAYAFAYEYVHDHDIAADISSEAIIKIIKKCKTFSETKGKGSPANNWKKYIETITYRTYLTYRERSKRESTIDELVRAMGLEDDEGRRLADDNDALDSYVSALAHKRFPPLKDNQLRNLAVKEVLNVITTIPDVRKRMAVELKFIYGLDTREIAKIMKEKFAAVNTLIDRSKKLLRKRLLQRKIDANYLNDDFWKGF